jgi:hypothetical protein
MKTGKIISAVTRKRYLELNEEELNSLLSHSDILLEKETHLSGKIRLLCLNDTFLIQEKSTKNEILVRLMKTKKEAEAFINKRLETYDRMWDGCGCKVEYYN